MPDCALPLGCVWIFLLLPVLWEAYPKPSWPRSKSKALPTTFSLLQLVSRIRFQSLLTLCWVLWHEMRSDFILHLNNRFRLLTSLIENVLSTVCFGHDCKYTRLSRALCSVLLVSLCVFPGVRWCFNHQVFSDAITMGTSPWALFGQFIVSVEGY